jgi:hypothetical protein
MNLDEMLRQCMTMDEYNELMELREHPGSMFIALDIMRETIGHGQASYTVTADISQHPDCGHYVPTVTLTTRDETIASYMGSHHETVEQANEQKDRVLKAHDFLTRLSHFKESITTYPTQQPGTN